MKTWPQLDIGTASADGCVIPVSAAAALAWAEGRLSDGDLLLRAQLIPEAVFLVNLPDRASYESILRRILFWRERGAVFMIARTGNSIVQSHICDKNWGLETYREAWNGNDTKYRFVIPPDAFTRWLGKFSRRPGRSAAPGAEDRQSAPIPALGPA